MVLPHGHTCSHLPGVPSRFLRLRSRVAPSWRQHLSARGGALQTVFAELVCSVPFLHVEGCMHGSLLHVIQYQGHVSMDVPFRNLQCVAALEEGLSARSNKVFTLTTGTPPLFTYR